MACIAVVDIGGTEIKHGVIDSRGIADERDVKDSRNFENARNEKDPLRIEFLCSGRVATEAAMGGPHIVNKVIALLENYQKEYELCGIALSSAGMVDIEKGEIFFSGPQIPQYAGTKWKAILDERFSVPVEIENDVNCAGLSEALSGAARGAESCLCLTIGTGIGGAIILDGRVYHGAGGSACEVGYLHLPGGAFQDLASTSTLTRRVAEIKKDPLEEWDGFHIFAAAKEGDPVCISEIDRLCDILGMGIANLCYTLDPSFVVLGGGIMQQKEYLHPRIQAALHNYLSPAIAGHVTLKMAENGNRAGMLGAYYHFHLMQEERKTVLCAGSGR